MIATVAPEEIYTDGSYCSYRGLGFPCGWAAVFPNRGTRAAPHVESGHTLNLVDSGSVEVLAVVKALESVETSSNVQLYMDNKELSSLVERYSKAPPERKAKLRREYLDDEQNNRITHDREGLRILFDALDQHTVSALWVRSHQSNAHETHYYNNIADEEAKKARNKAYPELDATSVGHRGNSPRAR